MGEFAAELTSASEDVATEDKFSEGVAEEASFDGEVEDEPFDGVAEDEPFDGVAEDEPFEADADDNAPLPSSEQEEKQKIKQKTRNKADNFLITIYTFLISYSSSFGLLQLSVIKIY